MAKYKCKFWSLTNENLEFANNTQTYWHSTNRQSNRRREETRQEPPSILRSPRGLPLAATDGILGKEERTSLAQRMYGTRGNCKISFLYKSVRVFRSAVVYYYLLHICTFNDMCLISCGLINYFMIRLQNAIYKL